SDCGETVARERSEGHSPRHWCARLEAWYSQGGNRIDVICGIRAQRIAQPRVTETCLVDQGRSDGAGVGAQILFVICKDLAACDADACGSLVFIAPAIPAGP